MISLRRVQAQLRVQLRLWFMNYLGLLYVFTLHLHRHTRQLPYSRTVNWTGYISALPG